MEIVIQVIPNNNIIILLFFSCLFCIISLNIFLETTILVIQKATISTAILLNKANTKTFLYQDKPAHSYHFDLKLVLQQKGKPVVHKLTINLCSNDYDLTPEEIEARNNEILYKIGFHFDIGDGRCIIL